MLRWFPNDDYNNQISAIKSWSQDIRILETMLEAGHAKTHLPDYSLHVESVAQCLDKISDIGADARKILPDDWALLLQINRVVNEGTSTSHFADKAVMLGALSTAITDTAYEINQWLTGAFTGQLHHFFLLETKMPSFIGSGIGVDGNERATNAVKIMFERDPCFVDGMRLPFSIQTAFPDISDKHDVGTVITTGHNFAAQLTHHIHRSSFPTQMYWALRERGENVIITDGKWPAAVMNAEVNGIQYGAFYSAKAAHNGYGHILVANPNTHVLTSLQYSGLSLADCSNIRNDETRRRGDCIQRASSRTQFAIVSPETLFPEMPPMIVRNGNHALEYEEISAYQENAAKDTLDITA